MWLIDHSEGEGACGMGGDVPPSMLCAVQKLILRFTVQAKVPVAYS